MRRASANPSGSLSVKAFRLTNFLTSSSVRAVPGSGFWVKVWGAKKSNNPVSLVFGKMGNMVSSKWEF